MSDIVHPQDEPKSPPKVITNGQLPSPTLSPICENAAIPFPNLGSVEEPNGDTVTRHDSQHVSFLNRPATRPDGTSNGFQSIDESYATTQALNGNSPHTPITVPQGSQEPTTQPSRDLLLRGAGVLELHQYASVDSGHRSTEDVTRSDELPKPTELLPRQTIEPQDTPKQSRPGRSERSASSPMFQRKQSSARLPKVKPQLSPLKHDEEHYEQHLATSKRSARQEGQPSPMPEMLPLPPLSLPTYLQLELSSTRPSALYVHRSESSDLPYESSSAKFERLLNFLLLPPALEQVLWFGAIACLDAWLYTFTILPLRFAKAIMLLVRWCVQRSLDEVRYLSRFVIDGVGRVWRRRKTNAESATASSLLPEGNPSKGTQHKAIENTERSQGNGTVSPAPPMAEAEPRRTSTRLRARRRRSRASALLPSQKADLLQGLLILCSCSVLMYFDASRMYHSIRGQSAIKLYVIYNVLEVFDRLFSALGQDILECLFSKETLERDEAGRSRIFRPIWMFMLALVYNVVHATALFYQVVTLNVAVNSYNNALLTLLMSNQFVEIKGTVFKKFEKDNLFQLTCADVVERFQLWLMLLIIALRNIVEVGGLSISLTSAFASSSSPAGSPAANTTNLPLLSGILIPRAFTLFPKWTGEVLGPFLIVLGSEAVVDWCKHAYISKFNNVKPNIYNRFLDVLAKDYYSHAFADQNLTKRLGLPVIPLSCLFIRACMQTYQMFLATHMPVSISSSATALSTESATTASSPATTAALQHIDHIFRRTLGRSWFSTGGDPNLSFSWWSIDDVTALATIIIVCLALYIILLACKLALGMCLLSFARGRYKGMKDRERQDSTTDGRRVGGWGVVEVGEDKRRWIYEDDPDALRELRAKETRGRKTSEKGDKLDSIERYKMAAKRIW